MKTSLNAQHHLHIDWLRELAFYNDELLILSNRLEEVARANTAMDVMQQVEHHQNRLILLKEELDIIKHDVNENEKALLDKVGQKQEFIHLRVVDSDEQLLARVQYLAVSVSEFRFEFNNFLARVL